MFKVWLSKTTEREREDSADKYPIIIINISIIIIIIIITTTIIIISFVIISG